MLTVLHDADQMLTSLSGDEWYTCIQTKHTLWWSLTVALRMWVSLRWSNAKTCLLRLINACHFISTNCSCVDGSPRWLSGCVFSKQGILFPAGDMMLAESWLISSSVMSRVKSTALPSFTCDLLTFPSVLGYKNHVSSNISFDHYDIMNTGLRFGGVSIPVVLDLKGLPRIGTSSFWIWIS